MKVESETKEVNTIPDLIPLHDSRPGLRTLLQVEVREPSESADHQPSTINHQPVLDFIASTATLDRYHEVIEPSGWRLDAYRRNPVFQNAHNYGDILFTLGKALVTEVRDVGSGPALCQRIQFATEVNPVARIAYGLYRGGFLRAVSVGFIPLRWEDGNSEKHGRLGEATLPGNTDGGRLGEATLPGGALSPKAPGSGRLGEAALPRRRYLEQELLEVSAVAIPANPDALALGLKSGAVEKGDLQEALALLRALAGAVQPENQECNRWLELARELRRVMRKA